MKRLSPEQDQLGVFEGLLSDIVSGVNLLCSEIEPYKPENQIQYFLYNLPVATKDVTSWTVKAALEDDDKNRIGISTFQQETMICGKVLRTVVQQINITAYNEPKDTLFKRSTMHNYGIQINPKKRRVLIDNDSKGYFDFKANPLTSRFGFRAGMESSEILSAFSSIVSAALRKELIIKAEF